MATNVKQLLEAANAAVPRITPAQAHEMIAKDNTLILYCASGGRSALAGKALKDLGYERVFNLGAFKDWADSGGTVEKV
jgi:rhodanese-related sulfurtransferase